MRFWYAIIFIVLLFTMIHCDFNSSEEDDSGSIELPQRPENRQEAKLADGQEISNSNTFLHLVAKFMNTVKKAIENTVQESKFKNSRNGLNKSKRTLKGLYRAHNLAQKAQKQFMKYLSINDKSDEMSN